MAKSSGQKVSKNGIAWGYPNCRFGFRIGMVFDFIVLYLFRSGPKNQRSLQPLATRVLKAIQGQRSLRGGLFIYYSPDWNQIVGVFPATCTWEFGQATFRDFGEPVFWLLKKVWSRSGPPPTHFRSISWESRLARFLSGFPDLTTLPTDSWFYMEDRWVSGRTGLDFRSFLPFPWRTYSRFLLVGSGLTRRSFPVCFIEDPVNFGEKTCQSIMGIADGECLLWGFTFDAIPFGKIAKASTGYSYLLGFL